MTSTHLGLKKSGFTVGRQVLDLNFVTPYNIRQKDQSYEAAVLHVGDLSRWDLTLGHLEEFSAWTSKDDLSTGTTNNFIDIEKTEGVPYDTNGFQFLEAAYTGYKHLGLSLYDYFGHDLYNTMGVKGHGEFSLFSEVKMAVKAHYIRQRDVGKYKDTMGSAIESDAFQAGLRITSGGFSIEPGVFTVGGDGPENTLHTPFQPALIIEEPMMETDLGFEGKSNSWYLESSYTRDIHKIYFLYLYTRAGHRTLADVDIKEANLIYKYDWNRAKGFYTALKLGYLVYEYETSDNVWMSDYRLFIGYKF